MCLRIDDQFITRKKAKEFLETPLIAKKNITVYKVLERCTHEGKGIIYSYSSPHRGASYYPGELKSVEKFSADILQVTWQWRIKINKGLHSYSAAAAEAYWTRNCSITGGRGLILIQCTIPKGTPYFKNKDGEYVSLKLQTPKEYKNEWH